MHGKRRAERERQRHGQVDGVEFRGAVGAANDGEPPLPQGMPDRQRQRAIPHRAADEQRGIGDGERRLVGIGAGRRQLQALRGGELQREKLLRVQGGDYTVQVRAKVLPGSVHYAVEGHGRVRTAHLTHRIPDEFPHLARIARAGADEHRVGGQVVERGQASRRAANDALPEGKLRRRRIAVEKGLHVVQSVGTRHDAQAESVHGIQAAGLEECRYAVHGLREGVAAGSVLCRQHVRKAAHGVDQFLEHVIGVRHDHQVAARIQVRKNRIVLGAHGGWIGRRSDCRSDGGNRKRCGRPRRLAGNACDCENRCNERTNAAKNVHGVSLA